MIDAALIKQHERRLLGELARAFREDRSVAHGIFIALAAVIAGEVHGVRVVAVAYTVPRKEAYGVCTGRLTANLAENAGHAALGVEGRGGRLDAWLGAVPLREAVNLWRNAAEDRLPVDGRRRRPVAAADRVKPFVAKSLEVRHHIPRNPPCAASVDTDEHDMLRGSTLALHRTRRAARRLACIAAHLFALAADCRRGDRRDHETNRQITLLHRSFVSFVVFVLLITLQ